MVILGLGILCLIGMLCGDSVPSADAICMMLAMLFFGFMIVTDGFKILRSKDNRRNRRK